MSFKINLKKNQNGQGKIREWVLLSLEAQTFITNVYRKRSLNKDKMDYSAYKTEDLAADPFFIAWVKHPTDENRAFWNAWLSQHPEHKPIVDEARRLVLMLDFKEAKAPEGKFLEIWGNILDATTEDRTSDTPTIPLPVYITEDASPKTNRSWYRLMAAACVVLMVGVAYIVWEQHDAVVVRTTYGESRTLFLPDSTKVTLNANSVLRYATDFSSGEREVWLDGEAFFAVVHTRSNQRFLVHTAELQVEVLGTRFNVNSRRGRSRVVLEEGKVKLDADEKMPHTPEVVLQPGELAEFSKTEKTIGKKKVDADQYSSWRNNQLVFVSASLAEVGQVLEDNYGYTVEFRNETLRQRRFTGSASVDNLPDLFHKLSRVFGLTIIQDGNKLTIE